MLRLLSSTIVDGQTAAMIVAALVAADIPVAPVKTITQVAEDRVSGARDAGQDGDPGRRRDVPAGSDDQDVEDARPRWPGADAGQHTDEVRSWFLGDDERRRSSRSLSGDQPGGGQPSQSQMPRPITHSRSLADSQGNSSVNKVIAWR
jgi:crotonobetainyl-CoA:carnitine CoA-transferase CaiB-like acyl-CoA transferase